MGKDCEFMDGFKKEAIKGTKGTKADPKQRRKKRKKVERSLRRIKGCEKDPRGSIRKKRKTDKKRKDFREKKPKRSTKREKRGENWRKNQRKKKGADAGVVERARLENEKSIRLVGSNPTLPGEKREVVAEWLNATDCNFVPITVRRFKSFPVHQNIGPL